VGIEYSCAYFTYFSYLSNHFAIGRMDVRAIQILLEYGKKDAPENGTRKVS